MDLCSMPLSRVAISGGVLLILLAAGVPPVAAQAGDLCGALTIEEVAAAVPGTYDAPAGFPDTCQWHGTTTAGADVDLIMYATPGSTADYAFPGVVQIDIGGQPAFSMADPTGSVPTQVVGAGLGDRLLLVTLATDDSSVDLPASAAQLASTAVDRLASAISQPHLDVAPADATHGDPCSLLSEAELATLMGVTLTAVPDGSGCVWQQADTSADAPIASVSVAFDSGGLATFQSIFPDGQEDHRGWPAGLSIQLRRYRHVDRHR